MFRDNLSFSLGVISVISWSVAEIPQIMTNYKTKSIEGVSIAFLTTWMLGDIFNIVGCLMEPATLPIQFYTAVLYTVATAVLYFQSIYYGHIYQRLNNRRNHDQMDVDVKEPLLPEQGTRWSTKSKICVVSTLTLFLGALCVVLTFLFLGKFNLLSGSRSMALAVGGGRKLLQVTSGNVGDNSKVGMLLGWAMAAIYMGGRLPQICLNIRRGHVDGLNPLMFFFALVGNVTYVASILVNSVKWSKIKPNLPWLADAGGCAVLDFLILLQFINFCCRKVDKDSDKEEHETGEEAV
ncbi:hypothetical protein V5N11_011567 [Cardamine amara subsp. amara]|uniref:PQ-loop repeat family protein / transmembrane family protein n=1 Tax=Cardamine amara subsp. amara TaxID=228776 RepID=A0ABD1APL8_CARAN